MFFFCLFRLLNISGFEDKEDFDYTRDVLNITDKVSCEASGKYEWKNSHINFDNVASAYLALLQVVGIYSFHGFMLFH